MRNKIACLVSGGGSYGAYGCGTLARLDRDYDIVVGISTGALATPFIALKEWDLLKIAYTSFNRDYVFDKKWYKPRPINKLGKINKSSIIISLLLGQTTVGTSNSLKKSIDMFLNENQYNDLQKRNKIIIVGAQNYAEQPSKIHYFNSMNETFSDFKDWMWCSANFPFYTSLVKKGWHDEQGNFHIGMWSDGGLSDLIGIDNLLGEKLKEVDIVLLRPHINVKYEGNEINSLLDNLTTTINAMRHNIEFDYLYDKISQLNDEGTIVNVYWLPRKLKTDSLVFNNDEMLKWWNEGYDTAYDSDRVDIFLPK